MANPRDALVDSTPTPRETPYSKRISRVSPREELAALAGSPVLSDHDVTLLLTIAHRLRRSR